MLPNLNELRLQLEIPSINTSREINLLGQPNSIITDDVEALHAIRDENGYIRLNSGIEIAMLMYRGQTQVYPRCVPTLARLESVEQQLLALCRRVAFEDAIGEHPMVRFAERVRLWEMPLFIDREGLAQHYGLATDMLDLTSNFDVASFFATCAWNAKNRKFEPVTSQEVPGILYLITPLLANELLYSKDGFSPIHTLGWQPLPRPEQQRAFVVKINRGQDFVTLPTVQGYRFKHRTDISERIWRAFNKGYDLYPPDETADLAQEAETLMQFTDSQVTRAWERLAHWNGRQYSPAEQNEANLAAEIITVKKPALSWDQYQVERNEEKLMERILEMRERIRWRRIAYVK